jgi:hypothetical protein
MSNRGKKARNSCLHRSRTYNKVLDLAEAKAYDRTFLFLEVDVYVLFSQ